MHFLQINLIRRILRKPRPLAINRHVHFLSFPEVLNRNSQWNPTYINFLRDPVGINQNFCFPHLR